MDKELLARFQEGKALPDDEFIVDDRSVHPTLRIGYAVQPGARPFITDLPCKTSGTICVVLASRGAIAYLQNESDDIYMTSLGQEDISIFISVDEFEENLLYPGE